MRYPQALWMPAHATNFRLGRVRHVDRITIHCTDGRGIAQNTAAMWQGPHHGSSAHFVIGQDGAVVQAVNTGDVAFHAHEANSRAIGVEHCARTPGELGKSDLGLPPSSEQYLASARLVAWLCWQYNLVPDRDTIQGHNEIDSTTTHTKCPTGCGWDWLEYMQMVCGEHDRLDA